MHNGVGLLTPRGSGTSGYVQSNKFNLRRAPHNANEGLKKLEEKPKEVKPNQEILLHNRKREIEVKLYELQMTLEDEGVPEEQIQAQLAAQRLTLERDLLDHEEAPSSFLEKGAQETHETARRKMEQMDRLKDALGLGDVKVGEAFDQELQEKRRQDQAAKREQMDRDRRKRFKEEKQRDDQGGEDRVRKSSGRENTRHGERERRASTKRQDRSRSRSPPKARSPSQRAGKERDDKRSERDENKDVSRVKQQHEVRQRAAECAAPPTMDSGDPRVSRVDSNQDGEDQKAAMLPSTHKLPPNEKNMEWGAPGALEEHNSGPRRGYRPQPRESEYSGGFPTEGRLSGRLQMGGDRRRENWRPGGSEWRGRGRFGRNGPGPGYGRGHRDGYNSWGGRWYDRGRGFRGRGRNWYSPQWGYQHVESGGYFRKDEIAPERYNPGGDPPEDLSFVNNRPANWEHAGRWPKSDDLDDEGKVERRSQGNMPMDNPAHSKEGPTRITRQGASLSPSPHSLMTVKRSPSQPVARRRPRDYRSECPSPSTDESMDIWPHGSQDGHNNMRDDFLPEKENGTVVENELPYSGLGGKSEIASAVQSQVFPVAMDVEVSKPLMELPPKPSAKIMPSPLPIIHHVSKHRHPDVDTRAVPQKQMSQDLSDRQVGDDDGNDLEKPASSKHHKNQSPGSPQASPLRKKRSLPKSQKSRSRSRTPSRSPSQSKSKSKNDSASRSGTPSGSGSRSRSRSESRSRSSSRSRSGGSKSSHSRHRGRQSNWKDRRYHYDDRRGRDYRGERGRHFVPRGRFDPNRYRNGPPGPGWMRNGGGYRGRFGGGQFRRYNSGPRYGGGSRYMRDRPVWNRPGDRRAIGRYGDRDKPYERRSRSRERPRRGRNESQDKSPHRRRSPSRSKSRSSRGTTPARENKGGKRAASASSESPPARRRQSASPKPTRK